MDNHRTLLIALNRTTERDLRTYRPPRPERRIRRRPRPGGTLAP